MAEAPKPKSKGGGAKPGGKPAPAASASGNTHILEAVFWIVCALFVLSFIMSILGFGNDFEGFIVRLSALFAALLTPLTFISAFVCVLLLMCVFYVSYLDSEVRRYALEKIDPDEAFEQYSSESIIAPLRKMNDRWQKVQQHIESQNPSDWRSAILESDIILDEMLQKMGYKGAGVGEMLKMVEKSDFLTLDAAWEAHKVRNNIAHQGSDFVMSHPEAKRIISLYRQVFEEFFYI